MSPNSTGRPRKNSKARNRAAGQAARHSAFQRVVDSTPAPPPPRPGDPAAVAVSVIIATLLLAGVLPYVIYPLFALVSTGHVAWPEAPHARVWMAIVAAIILVPAGVWVGFRLFIFRAPRRR